MGFRSRRTRHTIRIPRSPAGQAARDVDEEVQFHLDMRTEELIRAGVAPEDARAQALQEFGDLARMRTMLTRESTRTERHLRLMDLVDQVRQDLSYGWRKLWASPGFIAVAVTTLGLAIGGTSAIYSVVRHVLLASLDLPAPEQLVEIWPQLRLSPRLFEATRDATSDYHLRSYRSSGAWSHFTITLTGDGEPERLTGVRATADYFRVLGAEPALGRTFAADEDQPGRTAVAVLSHGLWRRRFGADPAVVGTTLTLEGQPHVVIGVMPAAFAVPHEADLWLPYELSPARRDYRAGFLRVFGRLRPGTTLEQAQSELDVLMRRIQANNPDIDPARLQGATVVELRERLVGEFRTPLYLLLGAVAFVLLLASTNIASLLFGRAVTRRREIAVRIALGASRPRLLRQLLVESVPLGVLGGAVGLLLALPGTALLVRHLPAGMPRLNDVAIDGSVLVFAAGLTVGASVLFGLFPAVFAGRRLGGTLREARGEAAGATRWRNTLVLAEVALGVVLVVAAGLFIKSLYRLQQVDPGFVPDGVLTLALSPPRAAYTGRPDRVVRLYDQLLADVAALPGVDRAGLVQVLPMAGTNRRGTIVLENAPAPSGRATPWAEYRVVSGEYFRTLGVPLRRGRTFTARDGAATPAVVMVNERFVQLYWPAEDPIGRRIRIPLWGGDTWYTVIGVVGAIRHEGPAHPAPPEVYVSYRQSPDPFAFVAIRSALADLTALAPAVRELVWRLDPDIPVSSVRPLTDVLGATVAQPRLLMSLLSAFGAVALGIAAIGLYGVMAFFVAQRTREIGVRLALGARPGVVGWLVVRRALILTATGVGLGIGGALALQDVLDGLLFQVRADDPWTLVAVGVAVIATGMVASALPTRRAIRVHPAVALRHD